MRILNLGIQGILMVMVVAGSSCSVQQKIDKAAKTELINKGGMRNAHTGISVYDPASNKYLYDYQGDKFFVPASNTKIFSCYAAMKYLGDSLTGIRYIEVDTAVYLLPTGDPSLLHSDYRVHPVYEFLKRTKKPLYISDQFWKSTALANGWAWNDFNQSYMPERSPMPVYGNYIRWVQERNAEANKDSMQFDQSVSIYSLPEVNWKVRFNADNSSKSFFVQRTKNENIYTITQGNEDKKEIEVPFVTNGLQAAIDLLPDTVLQEIRLAELPLSSEFLTKNKPVGIYSQPTDSVLKPMMHRSDNFFAEQVLLMAANEKLGMMDDDSIINYMLQTDLADLPQKPRWVDGSGLSRYDIFTPQSFVAILNKMKKEFPIERIKAIFPTPGRGTLTNYSKIDSGSMYAKTGSLSGVVALSGFLYTRTNRLLIFSVLVNNHRLNAAEVRNNIQTFLGYLRSNY